MNYKIKILSPVHVSTGNLNPCYLYHYDDGFMDCFRIEDLFKQVPTEQLLKMKFNTDNDWLKKEISAYFKRNIDYKKLQPQYYLESSVSDFTSDVKEQMKALNKPIIPGSSLKGTFMNIIIYDILHQQEDDIKEILHKMIRPNFKSFEKNLLKELFDHDFEAYFSKFSSCFIFRDLTFERMILCSSKRLKMRNNSAQFYYYECIDNEQNRIDEFLVIDEHRKKMFLQNINKIKKYQILEKYFDISELFKAANLYFKSLQIEEFNYFSDIEDKCADDIIKFLDGIYPNDHSCIVRVGNSTNYFYKTVSIFIKNNFNDFYNEHFELFAPATLEKKNSPKPKPNTMPKTRYVLSFGDYFYLAGFIEIEQCD